MRRGPYRLVMAAAFVTAGCQTTCDPACVAGGDPEACGGVSGLRLVLETVPGNTDFAPVGSLAQPGPTVQLLTAFLRTPVEDVPVVFTITGGGGRFDTVNPQDQTFTIETDANGRATIPNWRMGTAPGPNTVTASVDGVPLNATVKDTPRTFMVNATPAAAIAIQAGNNQTAAAAGLVPVDPEVIVTDGSGRPVQNLAVAFVVTGGGGSLIGGGSTVTDFFGRAKVVWKLGNAAGPNTLEVTAAGAGLSGNPLIFTANGVAGSAHTLSVFAGDNQTALRSTAVPVRPAVRLVDANQNPVPGVEVTFTPTLGGGSVQGSPVTTDANGVAEVGGWTLGPNSGPNGLSALAAGTGIIGNPVGFTATATAPVPASVVAFAGNGQTVVAGQPLPTRPAVRVTDAQGAPVAGVPVTFSAIIAPPFLVGSITGPDQITDVNGVATVGNWALGTAAGLYQMQAATTPPTVNGSPIGFTATAIAGTPVSMAKVAGDNQSAPVGLSPEVLPTVRITDFFGNPVAGVTITFAVTSGGGTVTGGIVVTNALGRATVGNWQLGPAPGPNTLSATASATTITGNPASFAATGFLIGVRAPQR